MKYNYDIEEHIETIRFLAARAGFVLEIGPAKGDGSTAAIEEGLLKSVAAKKLFISVDIRDYMERLPTVPFWQLVLGDSREESTLEQVKKIAGARYPDLIFIDTDHTYEQMKRELEVWVKIAGEKTVWLFHDTHMMGKYNHMTDAIKEFAEQSEYWEYKQLSIKGHGLGALIPKDEN